MMGIITGCIMIKCQNNAIVRINKFLELSGWAAAIYCFYTPFFLPFDTYREPWALTICWIIFACHQLNSGGLLRIFLSLPLWQPLSKICLCAYLVEFPYIMIMDANRKNSLWMHAWWQIHIYIGDIAVSFILGVILYLCVEVPVSRVTQIILNMNINLITKLTPQKDSDPCETVKLILD